MASGDADFFVELASPGLSAYERVLTDGILAIASHRIASDRPGPRP